MKPSTNKPRPFSLTVVVDNSGEVKSATGETQGKVGSALFDNGMLPISATARGQINNAQLENYGDVVLNYIERYPQAFDFVSSVEGDIFEKARTVTHTLRYVLGVAVMGDDKLSSKLKSETEKVIEIQKQGGDKEVKKYIFETINTTGIEGKVSRIHYLATLAGEVIDRATGSLNRQTQEEVEEEIKKASENL